jgi:hypothetical protein
MQSLSAKACKGRGSRLPARVLMTAPLARLHHGANTAAMGVRARQFRTMAVIYCKNRSAPNKLAAAPPIVARRRNPRPTAYSKRWHRAAGSAAFAEELRLIARRAAVSGDQDFIVLALHRAPWNAVRSDHSDARAGRTWRPFFTLRAWGPGGPAGPTDPASPLGPWGPAGP